MSKSNTLPVTAALLVIAVITVTAYLPGMSAGFFFDDDPNFARNPAMHWTEFNMEALRGTLTGAWEKSRVVANISLAATHAFSGLDPAPYHWTNLFIHLVVGLALLWVIRTLQYHHTKDQGGPWIALLLVLIFLVHPLNIQAVTYIVQRMTSMATLFFLLAFGCYLTGRFHVVLAKRLRWFLLSAVCLLLSIGSKEIGYLLPPLLLVYEIAFHGDEWRIKLLAWLSPKRRMMFASVIGTSSMIALIIVWQLLDGRIFWLETVPGFDFTGYERVLTQGRVQIFYLSLLIWPATSRLNLDHDFPVSTGLLTPPTTSITLAVGLIVLLWSIRNLQSRPRVAFPVLGYLLLHSVESAPLNLDLVFEHRMYQPMTMLALLFALNVDSLPKTYLRTSYATLLAIGLLLSFATYQRNEVWSDPIDFLRDTAQKSPDKWRPQYNLGTELGRYGMLSEASSHLERAIRIKPNDSESHNQLANVYMKGNQQKSAEKHYRMAIENDETNAEALYNLSMLLGSQRRYAEQETMLELFIQHAPPYLDEQKRQAAEYLRR
jgi:nitrogen fixation-related uncharacterized protein